jgi:tetratricopeptide (TPR) repeat protein
MIRIRRAICVVLLVMPSIAFATDKRFREIGPLLLTGRQDEARPRLERLRDEFAASGNKADEAAAWLLLGMSDTASENLVRGISELRTAADAFAAGGDHFGVWLCSFTIASLERREASSDASAADFERAFEAIRAARQPDAPFTIDTLMTMGEAFGANTDMVGPMAMQASMLKPIILQLVETITHDEFAVLLLDTGDFDRAETELKRASDMAALFGGVLDGSINLHYAQLRQLQWRLDEARDHYLKSLNNSQKVSPMFMPPAVANDPWIELNVLESLAELELLRGRVDEALAWNDRGLQLARERNDMRRQTQTLRARANLLSNAGRYEEARAVYDTVLERARGARDVRREADVEAGIGFAYFAEGAYGSAASHLEKSVALYGPLNQPYVEAPIWLLLAEVYMALNSDSNAALALQNAKKLAEKSNFTLAGALIDVVATIPKGMGGQARFADFDATFEALMRHPEMKTVNLMPDAATQIRDSFAAVRGLPISAPTMEANVPPLFKAFSIFLQAQSALKQRDTERVRRLCRQAIALNPNREHRAGLAAMIGASYLLDGRKEEATQAFRKAADGLDAVASDVKVEELLSSFLGGDRRYYFDLLIEMLIAENHPLEAFTQAERARARAFLQVVSNHRLNAAAGADPKLVAEAENVRAAIASREQELVSAAPDLAKKIAADLQNARAYYSALVIRMKTTNPEYAEITSAAPRDAASMGSDLPPHTTLLSYYVSAHAVHAWAIDRDSAHYELLPLDPAMLARLTCWAGQLGSGEARGVTVESSGCASSASADDAYRVLFAPLRKHIKHERLMIVPHGVLHYVPFAALRNAETSHYLVQDYTLMFAPSASAIQFLRDKETPVDGGALVLGDPATPLPGLDPLPGAAQEGTIVARTLGTNAQLGPDARESLLYGLDGKYDLVHLAAHATYESRDPLFSRVALAPGDRQDGSLTVTEILSSVDLRGVNLVVLSACRSAVGQRSGGDEIVGLTRALLYAGTPGVISTLWNISDTAAAGLMTDFYEQLAGGAAVADALRHAQLASIESAERGDPKYWAAFMLTGDPQGRWKSRAVQ